MKGQSINGKILDSISQPIPFATISLLNKSDSSIYRVTISDDKGNYTFENVNADEYYLKTLVFGYIDQYRIVAVTRYSESLPDIILKRSAVSLNEVEVLSIKRTIEYKNGNITFNVANSALATGSNLLDLLKKTPTVMTDNGNISIAGSEEVKIYMDGRPVQLAGESLLSLLKAINANAVDKIEVMKNPPVQYEANGTGGIINIKLKKSTITGFNGNINFNSSQGFYNRSDLNLSLNYKARRYAFFSSVNTDSSVFLEEQFLDRTVNDKGSYNNFDQHKFTKHPGKSMTYKLGMDFFPTKRTTFGWQVDGEAGKYQHNGESVNRITGNSALGFDVLRSTNINPEKQNFNNCNINLEHKFDTIGTVLNFSADYNQNKVSDKAYYENTFYDLNDLQTLLPNNYRNNGQFKFDIYSAKLDFTKVLKNDLSIETGAKGSYMASTKSYLFERLNNFTQQYFRDSSFSSDYDYNEAIYAGYLNIVKEFKYFNFEIGARAEQSFIYGKNKTTGFTFQPHYFNIYPNVSFEYQRTQKHNFQWGYNRRINRPTYEDLSPFKYFFDQYSSFVGNPYLSPEYCNKFSFSHTYKEVFTNSFSYENTRHTIMNVTSQNDSTKEFLATNVNLNYSENYNLTSLLQVSPRSWYDLNITLMLFYNRYNGKLGQYDLDQGRLTFFGLMNNVFILPKNYRIEANFFYRGPKAMGSLTVRAKYGLDLGINKKLCKERFVIGIGMDDAFYTNIGATYNTFGNMNWKFRVKEDTQRFKISLTYNFGKTKVTERDVMSNEQEIERLGK